MFLQLIYRSSTQHSCHIVLLDLLSAFGFNDQTCCLWHQLCLWPIYKPLKASPRNSVLVPNAQVFPCKLQRLLHQSRSKTELHQFQKEIVGVVFISLSQLINVNIVFSFFFLGWTYFKHQLLCQQYVANRLDTDSFADGYGPCGARSALLTLMSVGVLLH